MNTSELNQRPVARLRSERGGAFLKLLVLMAIVVAVVVLAWMIFLPTTVAKVLTDRSGFRTEISKLAFNPIGGGFSGSELEITNPAVYGGDAFVKVAQFSGRLETSTVTKEEFVIDELFIDLTAIKVIIPGDGTSNAEAFGEALIAQITTSPDYPDYAVAGLPVIGDGPQRVLIRRLHLKIGRVDVVQPDLGAKGSFGEQFNFEGTFDNVRRWQDMFTPELVKRLAQSPAVWQALLSSGILPEDLGGAGPLQEIWRKAGSTLNSFLRKLDQTPKP
ncbi:hypothetical protein [Synoicihabitans lomoniglobus]|uniref:AsmA domain-containing protein n=1 Tax=Synoicihabitans lomoniglobus TaxID=2909285 RepID=A0AAE9ZVM9_9BACT|nr:hypothetical protein [Opitutaceae bacterium LMO-M01]WED63984.1 hypothetical protein PXH66_16725 [Opitutaceae bacterium LMO-M01]